MENIFKCSCGGDLIMGKIYDKKIIYDCSICHRIKGFPDIKDFYKK